MAVFFCMAITEAKPTPVKKVKNSKFPLSCRLCEVSVVANDGYYSLCSDNTKKLGVEENPSLLGRVFCGVLCNRSVLDALKNTRLH